MGGGDGDVGRDEAGAGQQVNLGGTGVLPALISQACTPQQSQHSPGQNRSLHNKEGRLFRRFGAFQNLEKLT